MVLRGWARREGRLLRSARRGGSPLGTRQAPLIGRPGAAAAGAGQQVRALNVHEHLAHDLMRDAGIRTPKGGVAATVEEVERIAAQPVSVRMRAALRSPAAWLGCDALDTGEYSRRAPGVALDAILPRCFLARVRTLRVAAGEAPPRLAELVRLCAPRLREFECAADQVPARRPPRPQPLR